MVRRSKHCIRGFEVQTGIKTNTQTPNYDLPTSIAVDAADAAVGALLFQTVDGIEHQTCFLSRKLRQSALNYSTIEKEALALITTVCAFSV